MLKRLARRWQWVSCAVILVSILPVGILSTWLGVFVWRTGVTYHVEQTLTVANEGTTPQTLGLVAWVVPPSSASQQTHILITSSPVEPWRDEGMLLSVVSDLSPIGPGERAVYRLDLDVDVSDGVADATEEAPDSSYTTPGPFLEADDPRIVAQARAIVGNATDPAVKARRVYDFVVGNIRNQGLGESSPEEFGPNQVGLPGVQSGALWTLDHGYGVCGNFAALDAALCRAAGVPARIVGGWADAFPIPLLNREGDWNAPLGAHAWSEVYLPGRLSGSNQRTEGWLPVDAFWGQGFAPLREKYFLDLDNMHIALGDESELRPAFYRLVSRAQAKGFVASMSGPYWYVVAMPADANLTVTPHMLVRVEGLPTVWRPLVVFLVAMVAWGLVVDLGLRVWARRAPASARKRARKR